MRISQLDSLTEMELCLLLYVVNILSPVGPELEITPRLLLSVKHDALLWKLSQIQPQLNEEGTKVFTSLMTKLNKTWLDEVTEHENSTKTELSQPEFQF